MYRCYFTRKGKIVAGENLEAGSLHDAIEQGRRMLAERATTEVVDGIEIWQDTLLLFSS